MLLTSFSLSCIALSRKRRTVAIIVKRTTRAKTASVVNAVRSLLRSRFLRKRRKSFMGSFHSGIVGAGLCVSWCWPCLERAIQERESHDQHERDQRDQDHAPSNGNQEKDQRWAENDDKQDLP